MVRRQEVVNLMTPFQNHDLCWGQHEMLLLQT